jgi:hypothetical protein
MARCYPSLSRIFLYLVFGAPDQTGKNHRSFFQARVRDLQEGDPKECWRYRVKSTQNVTRIFASASEHKTKMKFRTGTVRKGFGSHSYGSSANTGTPLFAILHR